MINAPVSFHITLVQPHKCTALHFSQQPFIPFTLLFHFNCNCSSHFQHETPIFSTILLVTCVINRYTVFAFFFLRPLIQTSLSNPIIGHWELLWWPLTSLPAPLLPLVSFLILFLSYMYIWFLIPILTNLYTEDDKYSILLKSVWIWYMLVSFLTRRNICLINDIIWDRYDLFVVILHCILTLLSSSVYFG